MRTYELMIVLDPRMSEDDAGDLTDNIRSQVENAGAEVLKMENWGRRKLGFEIQKLTEGRYVLFYLSTEDGNHSLPTVERRLQQHDQVLRYLTVRTDEDLRRAGLPLPTAEEPEEEAPAEAAAGEEGEAKATEENAAETKAAEAKADDEGGSDDGSTDKSDDTDDIDDGDAGKDEEE